MKVNNIIHLLIFVMVLLLPSTTCLTTYPDGENGPAYRPSSRIAEPRFLNIFQYLPSGLNIFKRELPKRQKKRQQPKPIQVASYPQTAYTYEINQSPTKYHPQSAKGISIHSQGSERLPNTYSHPRPHHHPTQIHHEIKPLHQNRPNPHKRVPQIHQVSHVHHQNAINSVHSSSTIHSKPTQYISFKHTNNKLQYIPISEHEKPHKHINEASFSKHKAPVYVKSPVVFSQSFTSGQPSKDLKKPKFGFGPPKGEDTVSIYPNNPIHKTRPLTNPKPHNNYKLPNQGGHHKVHPEEQLFGYGPPKEEDKILFDSTSQSYDNFSFGSKKSPRQAQDYHRQKQNGNRPSVKSSSTLNVNLVPSRIRPIPIKQMESETAQKAPNYEFRTTPYDFPHPTPHQSDRNNPELSSSFKSNTDLSQHVDIADHVEYLINDVDSKTKSNSIVDIDIQPLQYVKHSLDENNLSKSESIKNPLISSKTALNNLVFSDIQGNFQNRDTRMNRENIQSFSGSREQFPTIFRPPSGFQNFQMNDETIKQFQNHRKTEELPKEVWRNLERNRNNEVGESSGLVVPQTSKQFRYRTASKNKNNRSRFKPKTGLRSNVVAKEVPSFRETNLKQFVPRPVALNSNKRKLPSLDSSFKPSLPDLSNFKPSSAAPSPFPSSNSIIEDETVDDLHSFVLPSTSIFFTEDAWKKSEVYPA